MSRVTDALAPMTDVEHREVALAGTGLGAVIAGFVAHDLTGGDWNLIGTHLTFDLWLPVWLGLITIGLRGVGILRVARAWLLGFFGSTALAYGLYTAATWAFELSDDLRSAVVVPAIEEATKLLPLVLLLTVWRGRLRWPTATDVTLVGFAAGAAFGFREDLIRDRVAADGFVGGWGALFPTTLTDDAGRVLLTHGGWTMVAGLGLWWAFTYRSVSAWLGGSLAVSLSVVDHGTANVASYWPPIIEDTLRSQPVAPGVMVVAIAGALVHDTVVLAVTDRKDGITPSMPASVIARCAVAREGSADAALRYRRRRNAAHVHSWRTIRQGRALGDRRAVIDDLRALHPTSAAST